MTLCNEEKLDAQLKLWTVQIHVLKARADKAKSKARSTEESKTDTSV